VLDIQGQKAGVIHATLLEEGTKRPVDGARIWGFDRETGSDARYNAYTDQQGRTTFYSAPAEIHLSVAGHPREPAQRPRHLMRMGIFDLSRGVKTPCELFIAGVRGCGAGMLSSFIISNTVPVQKPL